MKEVTPYFFGKNENLKSYLLNYIIIFVALRLSHILLCDYCVLLYFIRHKGIIQIRIWFQI
jgi:hypothetical protein